MHQLPQYVVECLVRLLYNKGIMRGDNKAIIEARPDNLPAVPTRHPQGKQAHTLCGLQRLQHIGTATIGGKAERYVLGPG